MDFSAAGGSQSFTVTSDRSFTVTKETDSFNIINGNPSVSGNQVTVTVRSTTTDQTRRVAELSVTSNGITKTVYVVRAAYEPQVTWRITPTSLSFSPSSIVAGNTATCTSNIRKRKYIDGSATSVYGTASLTWSSVNTSIATVSNGTVTGVAAGSTTISATDTSCETGYQVASGSITVTAPSYSISVNPTSRSWDFDETGSKTISVSTNDTG